MKPLAIIHGLSLELEERQLGLSPVTISRYVEVDSDDEAYQALLSQDFLTVWDANSARSIAEALAQSVQDEVPAKHVWNIRLEKKAEQGEAYFVQAGTVCLLGRQTDKPTRVLINMLPYASSSRCLRRSWRSSDPNRN